VQADPCQHADVRGLPLVLSVLLLAAGCGGGDGEATPSPGASPTVGPLAPLTGSPTAVVAKVPVGGQPCGVLSAAGSVWVTDASEGLLRRIDPATHRVVSTTRVTQTPCELTYGFGSIWVAGQRGSLDRVEPSTGRVVKRLEVGLTSYEPVVAFGRVWVSNRGSGDISVVDPKTNRVTSVETPGMSPGGLVAEGGFLWVGDDTDGARAFARLDPRSHRLTRITSPSRPSFVAAAAGRVWAASEDEGTVTGYDARTLKPVGPALAAGTRPVNLSGLLDREVWVPDDLGSLLTRIDARTNKVVERLAVCPGPAVVAPAGGDVWVSCFEGGEVWHLHPGS
jgi:YVTN family beta-propeller protein